MIHLLADNPLLLLFVVSAAGFLVGRLKIAGFHLGVAAVLFVGLGFGALHPDLRLPEFVQLFGLALFVYTVGLSSGPGFFASLGRRGVRDALFTAGMLLVGACLAAVATRAAGFDRAVCAGLFAGALTSTPALAGVIEQLKTAPAGAGEALANSAVVAYSVTYPGGVLGVLGAIHLMQRVFRVGETEPLGQRTTDVARQHITNLTVRITREQALHEPAAVLRRRHGFRVLFGRMRRGAELSLATDETFFAIGDLVGVIGADADVAVALAFLGEPAAESLELDRRTLDFRRMFVSRAEVTERPLLSLELPERFGALITRIRRGDVDFLPDDGIALELGDRVRVVAPRDRMEAVAGFLGDSYKALAEIDVITFSLGIALGLLAGSVPIPIPGGVPLKLGFAGGPLIAGLVLGRLGRTGRLVWTLPYTANLTLRQLGVVLFLAGVGTRSGFAFAHTIRDGGALALFACGAAVTLTISLGTLILGRRLLRIPMDVLLGMLAGIQTQPAVLAFSLEQTKNDLPNSGYASVYPVATLTKIVVAQLLAGFL